MSLPQWMTTLSLALEIPFDSKEGKIWTKLVQKYEKFNEAFIATLSTIDIVRLPFINYSFIKWFVYQTEDIQKQQTIIFTTIQYEIQAHIRKRVFNEFLNLQQIEADQFKENLDKLQTKVADIEIMHKENQSIANISKFLTALHEEIKELEETKENDSSLDS